MVLPHDLLVLTWIAAVIDDSSQMERCPTSQSQKECFTYESPSDVACVEIAPHQGDGHKVNYKCHNGANDHLVIDLVYLRVNIENLADD